MFFLPFYFIQSRRCACRSLIQTPSSGLKHKQNMLSFKNGNNSVTIHHSWSPNPLPQPPQISESIFVGDLWHHRVTLTDGSKNTNAIQIWMYILKFGSSDVGFWHNLAPQIMKKETIRFPSPHVDRWLSLHKKGGVNWIMTERAVEPSMLITYYA